MLSFPGFNRLRVFHHVVKSGSMAAAATELGVNKAGISQLMGSLEREVGNQLLIRTNQGIILTQSGERLFRVVDPFVRELDSVLASLPKNTREQKRTDPVVKQWLADPESLLPGADEKIQKQVLRLRKEGDALPTICKHTGLSKRVVQKILLAANVPFEHVGYLSGKRPAIIKRYLAGESASELARAYRASSASISYQLRAGGVKLRVRVSVFEGLLPRKKQIVRMRREGQTYQEIASSLDVPVHQVVEFLGQLGLTQKPPKCDPTRVQKLLRKGMSCPQIAQKLGVSYYEVRKAVV